MEFNSLILLNAINKKKIMYVNLIIWISRKSKLLDQISTDILYIALWEIKPTGGALADADEFHCQTVNLKTYLFNYLVELLTFWYNIKSNSCISITISISKYPTQTSCIRLIRFVWDGDPNFFHFTGWRLQLQWKWCILHWLW